MTKVRVCVVSPLYHPSLGGLGRQAQLLTERLADEGIEVFVVARRMKGMPPAAFSPAVKVYRAWSLRPYLHNFEKVTAVNILVSLTFSLSCALLLIRKRGDYDVVHFHGASLPLFANILFMKLFGKKIIAKVAAAGIGTEAGSLRGRYLGLGKLISMLVRKVDAVIATTHEIEEGLKADGFPGRRIVRIPNFIDCTKFFPVREQVKCEAKAKIGLADRRIVTFSGRFIPRKGIGLLIEAWRDVAKACPGAVLLLVGDGPLLGEMKKAAAASGISDSVRFTGHVDVISDYLHATDVFVVPSYQEGMPNSLLEAMACGLPVVAAKIGGVVDIIKDGENGVLTTPGSSKCLARKIMELLSDGERANVLSLHAAKTIESSYSLSEIVQRYALLYRRLLQGESDR